MTKTLPTSKLHRSRPYLLFLLLGITGCQSATLQSPAADKTAKRFVTESGTAKLYVYRLSGLAGAIRVEPVFIDGRMLGQNGPGTYLTTDLAPGLHTVATTASTIQLDAKVGTVCFVQQKMSVWGPTSSVEQVTGNEGMKSVELCNRAASLY